jgi:hypothetical protein
MKPMISLTKKSQLNRFNTGLKRLAGQRVLVGIPESKNARDHGSGKVGNAALMFIHTNGSQLRNLPKRAVIEPALVAEPNRSRILAHLKRAAQYDLDGDKANAIRELRLAGQLGANAARNWFTDPRNDWPPDKPATIKRKLRRMSPAAKKAAKALLSVGDFASIGEIKRKLRKMSPAVKKAAKAMLSVGDFASIGETLIDWGEMRRAITFVVEQGEEAGEDSGEAPRNETPKAKRPEPDGVAENLGEGVAESGEEGLEGAAEALLL